VADCRVASPGIVLAGALAGESEDGFWKTFSL